MVATLKAAHDVRRSLLFSAGLCTEQALRVSFSLDQDNKLVEWINAQSVLSSFKQRCKKREKINAAIAAYRLVLSINCFPSAQIQFTSVGLDQKSEQASLSQRHSTWTE